MGFLQRVRCGHTLALLGCLGLLFLSRAASAQQQQAPTQARQLLTGVAAPMTAEQRASEFAELAQQASALEQQERLLRRVVKLVKPSVVHIDAKTYNTHPPRSVMRLPVEETGSGVIVQLNQHDDRKYILTNLHVIRRASPENIRVRMADGREIHPTKLWSDSDSDVAVLAVGAASLVPARLGDSRQVEIGDFVLAFGSPFGLSHSVTFGIIGAKGRRDLALSSQQQLRIQEFLQTDAAINPGNSGGPLVNLRGEVVGINTAIASNSGGSEGIGFSIPIHMAIIVARQLVTSGNVTYAYLGVSWDSAFTPAEAAQLGLPQLGGARVKQVTPGSPASNAKLRTGDVIVRFDGIEIEDGTHLANLVGLTPVGKRLPVVIYRSGQALTVQVTLGERRLFDPR